MLSVTLLLVLVDVKTSACENKQVLFELELVQVRIRGYYFQKAGMKRGQ